MKIKCTLILTLTVWISLAQNPVFSWAKRMGGPSTDIGYGMVVDGSNNVFSTGFYNGTVDFDPGTGVYNLTAPGGFDDAFIQKLDANGNFLWAVSIGSSTDDYGNSISTDASGNVYVTGQFQGTVDFDPGAAVYNLTSAGAYDVFILKLDANGNFLWARSIGSTGSDIGYSIKTDSSGDIYTTGTFQATTVDFDPGPGIFNLNSNGADDGFIEKLDANGNFLWARSIGGSASDFAYAITTDGAGNVFTSGYFQGANVDFDPGAGVFSLTSAGGEDIFVQKLDASGNFIWAKRIGSSANDIGYAISTDASGNVITAGTFRNNPDFDPGSGIFTLSSAGQEDVFILKLDASGNFIWAKRMGSTSSDVGCSITTDSFGNVFTTGYFGLTVDFDPAAAVFNLTSSGSTDIFIQKLDVAGNFVWAVSMGGSSSDQGKAIALDVSGNIYTNGGFQNTVDFDSGPGVYNLSASLVDIFVHKLAPCASAPAQPLSISGSTAICSGAGAISYSVSAISGAMSYSWALPAGWSGSSSTNTISAIPGLSGIFTVTATNACGPSAAQTLSVTVSSPQLTLTPGMIMCNGICNGTITASTSGGIPNYTYAPAVLNNLCAGAYTVTVTDRFGCVDSKIASITQPAAPLTLSVTSIINDSCNGLCNGSAMFTANGGTPSYNISPSPTNLCAGLHTFTVTDANACVTTAMVNITQPGAITVSPSSGTVVCNGACANVSAIATGGTGAFSYTWQPGNLTGNTQTVCPTSQTVYTVIAKDANNCSGFNVTTVTVNPQPIINVSTNDTLICAGQSVTLTANGASTYSWEPGGPGTSIIVSPTITSNYTITGVDNNGCANTSVFTQNVSACTGIPSLASAGEETVQIFPNPFSSQITISAFAPVTFPIQVCNSLGSVIYSGKVENGTSGIDLSEQPKGIYFVKIGTATKKIIKE